MKKKKGFTFIETLIVVGIIVLLASTVIITINPARRFEEARDRQREIHLQSILSAVEQKRTIERGWADCSDIPDQVDEGNFPVFKMIGEGLDNYDLFQCIVPSYLSTILFDPSEGDREDTRYQIWQNPYSRRVTLRYVKDDKEIVAGPAEYWVLGIPTVITADPFNVTSSSAEGGGNVTEDGDSLVFERGVVWDSSTQPTITDNRTVDGSGLGSFSSSMTGLQAGVTYYLRAYARNDVGVSYGQERTFSTCSSEGSVATLAATNVLNDSATIRGSITCLGAQNPDRRFEWGETESYGNVTSAGVGGFGDFSVDLTALEIGQTYYYRACIVSASGTDCGSQMSFTTEISEPRVTTSDTTNITGTSVTSGGNVTNAGGVSVTARGVCYNTFGNPDTTDTCTTDGSGIGPFNSNISGLNPGTTYYVRAYATNSVGTGYGSQRSFTTSVILATVNTTEPSNVTGDSAVTGGNVTNEGGGSVTARGVCYNTTGGPNTSHSCTTDGSGLGIFTSSLSGLAGGTTYYVRAYATNSAGTAYGEERSFNTVASPPQVTTRAAFNIGVASADSGGEVLSTGGEPVTARGICYNTFGNPTLSDECTSDGSGLGLFTSFLSGLDPGTTYYVRAYATNVINTAYGNQIEFTTNATLASLTTTSVTGIGYDSATSGGSITSDGGGDVTVRGICWSVSPGPHAGLETCTDDGSGVGSFSSNMTSLLGSTLYYVRAYATNSAGTAYGNELTFTTATPQTPLLTTNEITNITRNTADSGGNVTDQRGAPVTVRGVCWNTVGSPTTADTCTTNGSGLGSFNSSITGLTAGTSYYVRAYATNSAGTGYGNQRSFISSPLIVPELTTNSISNIAATSARSGGDIIDGGGTSVTARGVCYNTTGSPTTSDTCTSNGSGLGSFTSDMTGLAKGTIYYIRAYATNGTGTGYGNQRSFTTLTTLPVVETAAAVSNVTGTSATSGGTVTDHGGDPNTSRGVCWGTSTDPTLGANCTSDGNGTGTFVSNMTGLSPGTTYYVRAYAANSVGVAYGVNRTFTTLVIAPTVTTTDVTNVERYTATSGGNVTASGGASVTARGVCYNTTGSPTISDTCTSNGTGLGSFISDMTNLDPGITYYVRAYATNSADTGYGSTKTFTTIFPELATVTTTPPSNVRYDSATSGGNVTNDGGDLNTLRGVCYATTADPRYGIHSCTSDGNGVGSFVSQMTGLTLGQTYYVRAYAHNTMGTAYGTQYNFTTIIVVPTVTTNANVTNITRTSATSGGEVTDHGGGTVTARGACYSTSQNPSVGGVGVTCTSDGTGTGIFTSNLSLNPGITYYVRAYATNSAGHGYGESRTFTTPALLSVSKSSLGFGTVTSSPSGINCGSTCGFEYLGGTSVTLTANADSGSVFAGWDLCPGTISSNQCQSILMNQDRSATAKFITTTSAPTSLTATAVSTSQINLSWNTPSSDGGSTITGYRIQRRVNAGSWSTLVANTGNTNTTFSDTGLSQLTTYTYRVAAINSVGTSLNSNEAGDTVPDACGGSANTNWGAGPAGCSNSNQRCYNQQCRTATNSSTSYLNSDGCGNCAAQGGNVNWRRGSSGVSCTSVCNNFGGCVAANWNASHTIINYFAQALESRNVSNESMASTIAPGFGSCGYCTDWEGTTCYGSETRWCNYTRWSGSSQSCGALSSVSSYYRICACQF